MKYTLKIFMMMLALVAVSCSGEKKEKKSFTYEQKETKKEEAKKEEATTSVPASKRIDLENKGVGPVKSVTLNDQVDQEMAANGKELYKQYCMACHKPDKKFIGPAPKGIFERRSPEWIMNMILNPDVMVKEDPLAKDLLVEFNGSPMANQSLNQEQTRAILEYFRTIK